VRRPGPQLPVYGNDGYPDPVVGLSAISGGGDNAVREPGGQGFDKGFFLLGGASGVAEDQAKSAFGAFLLYGVG
jgi:hypothetical protein